MPAKSEKQRKLFGAAKGCQEGTSACTGNAAKIAKSVDPKTVREFARRPQPQPRGKKK